MPNSTIPEEVVNVVNNPDVDQELTPDFSGKSPEDLIVIFQQLGASVDRLHRSKEAEAVKAAFYKVLAHLKAAAEEAGEDVVAKFTGVEERFKAIYSDYKHERALYNRQIEAERDANLAQKKAIIEELRALVEAEDEVGSAFPAFKEIQTKWRAVGPVPAQYFRDINDTYQFLVEKFYDKVKINHDLRDLDFKKNLEAKEALCEAAEKLVADENTVGAFAELQKLHEQWKDLGPVAKEYRDAIWERFKLATAELNKKYQAHFESIKKEQEQNLELKSALCEKVEAIAEADVEDAAQWNSLTKEIESIQEEWRKIGFATKKENQKIYARFREACDKFFARKRDFYAGVKDGMNENVAKKMAIIEQAEALKSSTEWKKATDQFIALQKQWKEVGVVPRKKSEMLWKRFRAACDEFFAERDKQAKPENDFYGNLRAKKALIAEIEAYQLQGGEADVKAEAEFVERYKAIGFVPFKEKDAVAQSYQAAIKAKFPRAPRGNNRGARPARVVSPKEELIRKFNALQQDIATYENNIGFFSLGKNSGGLLAQMQEKIDASKKELAALKEQIRNIEEEEQQNG